ncbi:hypothetical protein NXY11_14100 [Parabacteroides faecis]|nr:hypothetical protein [Parabacteroides faecis]MCS2892068.1 hypothetical protein [Parabacteroides faecis]UVQ49290.1 hypothetical protein NXY11_14100 [Parabacteroides faecis]
MKTKYLMFALATLLLGACTDDEIGGEGSGSGQSRKRAKRPLGLP